MYVGLSVSVERLDSQRTKLPLNLQIWVFYENLKKNPDWIKSHKTTDASHENLLVFMQSVIIQIDLVFCEVRTDTFDDINISLFRRQTRESSLAMYEIGKGNTIYCLLQQKYNKFEKERKKERCTL